MEMRSPFAPFIEASSMSGFEIAASAAESARFSPEASPVPIIALPISRITARTSAKSRLIRPSFTIRSVMQAIPEYSTWSAIAKASGTVVFSFATLNRFWLGMMISVSTLFCSSMMPVSASRMRRWPSKWNGLVTTTTVRMPSSRAARATTGEAPVPVPPPMPAVTNTIWAPERWSRISSITSSAAARPTSGCEPAPSPSVTCTPIWMTRSALEEVSAWASVLATTKSTPSSPLAIMLLTALPPAPPHPKTVIRGLSSRMSGIFRLMLMAASSLRGVLRPPRVEPVRHRLIGNTGSSEALLQPASDPSDVAASTRARVAHPARLEVFKMRNLRVDQETGRGREGGALGGLRHSGNAERPGDADRPIEDAGGEIGEPAQLAGAAGQDHVCARFDGEGRGGQPIAHDFEDLLDARLDDANDRGAGSELGSVALVMPGRRYGDHIALIRPAGQHSAIQRLDSLSVGEVGVEPLGEVGGHVAAAEREAVDVDETPAGKDRDAGGARPHVDNGGAEIGLVVGQHRQPRHIGACDQRLDRQMAALHRQHQVSHHEKVGRRDMHVDAEAPADHPARVANAARFVERVGDRQRMQERAAGARGVLAAGREHARDVAVRHRGAGDVDRGRHQLARRPPGRHRDHDRLEL